MKKVLIISYYWPPSGGAAVQRWLKFSKYLRKYGWEPVIYTVENGEFPQVDPSLEKEVPEGVEVIRKPIFEPYSFYKKLTGKQQESNLQPELVNSNNEKSFMENFAIWVRGNFFIPDARKFWIRPSIKHLEKYLEHNPIDVIVSTSPPQTDHLIALGIAQKFNILWLADFRDPWTKVDYFDQLKLSSRAERKHKKLEQAVLKKANHVLTVSYTWADDFKELGAKEVSVITNGYDTEDLPRRKVALDEYFSITHIGNISGGRVHKSLFEAFSELKKENVAFSDQAKLKLAGSIHPDFHSKVQEFELQDHLNDFGLIPHKKAVEETCSAQVLLLLLGARSKSKGRIPLKVFEYIASGRPIIGIGPTDSDVARILEKSGNGKMIDFEDKTMLKKELLYYFQLFQKGENQSSVKNASQYSREQLTGELAQILNKITQ